MAQVNSTLSSLLSDTVYASLASARLPTIPFELGCLVLFRVSTVHAFETEQNLNIFKHISGALNTILLPKANLKWYLFFT